MGNGSASPESARGWPISCRASWRAGTGHLSDTVVISATAPDRRDVLPPEKAAARAWIRANEARLVLPVTAVAEIGSGTGKREGSGAVRHAHDLRPQLAALQARHLQHEARRHGVAPGFADLTIACIARARGLAVATRNIRDFAPRGVEVVNPFEG